MLPFYPNNLLTLLHILGYFAVFFIIGGESMGLLLPGETILISASIYAGTSHKLNIYLVIIAAILGAVIGDNAGYLIGRWGGFRLLRRFGKYVKIDDKLLKVGQYVFMLHGGKIVFFGRFISFLRTWAAFFAGVNKMHWKRFLLFNAAGGILWASYYGILGYIFGKHVHEFSRPVRISFFILGTVFVVASFAYVRLHLKALEKKAEKALPGPLK